MSARPAVRRVAGGVLLLAGSLGAQDSEPPVADEIEDLSSLSRLATATPRPLERLPSTVTIIPGDEVRRSGARFLPDALRMLPGVEVNRISSSEVSVNMRGYNATPIASQGIMALVDGRQAVHAWLGFPLWDVIPADMDELDRVEVLLGPGSFVYGPNAMHGVVNIVTRSPLSYDADYLSLGTSGGTYDSTRARLTSVHRREDFALKTTLLWDDIDQFTPREDNAKDMASAELRFETLLDEDDPLHRLDLTLNRSRKDHNILIPTLAPIGGTMYRDESDETFFRGEYQNHGFRTQFSWSNYTGEGVPDAVYTTFYIELDTLDLDVQYSREVARGHELTAGAGIRSSTARGRDYDVADGQHTATTHWLFLQDELTLWDSWFLTAGVRYDDHSEVGSNVAPRLALLWEFDQESVDGVRTRTQSLRASYGEGFRYPSLSDLWLDLPVSVGPFTFPIIGNQDLEQETLKSYELAYTGTFGDTHLGATGFYNRIEDLMGFVPSIPATRANQEDETAYGFELRGDHPLTDWLTGFGNYSYTSRKDENGSEDLAPRHKFTLGARVEPLDPPASDPELGLHATCWLHYFDQTELIGKALESYWLLNAYVGYEFLLGSRRDRTRWNVYLQGFNLLDDDHFEHPEGHPYGALLMAGVSVSF